MKNIAVIGSGSWGIALALLLHRNGHHIKIWSYSADEARSINEDKKCLLLPGVDMPEDFVCYTSLEETMKGAEIVLMVTPSSAIRTTLNNLKPFVTENQTFVLCSKGMEPDTQKVYTDVISEILPEVKVAALSGPSHAEEVSQNIPTAVVIAANEEETANELQNIFSSDTFRVYTSTDLYGVELGGSLKNIIALSCGIAVGLGYGDNTIAALITRGLLEISRLGTITGAKQETFYGLTGLGDLFVTCASKHSRNRKCGILIGQGKSAEEAKAEVGMVVEGISALEGAYAMIQKHQVYAPIISEVYDVVKNGKSPQEATLNLVTKGKKAEF
ncbi:MAG: NAD(P)-dependent glycerol-3-phosphate dehydrogenase [Clostridia bacterium]|nr:NAD(P)-dependent glycerol-3-phosphate dehydrogenase [Clostridia bacterium]